MSESLTLLFVDVWLDALTTKYGQPVSNPTDPTSHNSQQSVEKGSSRTAIVTALIATFGTIAAAAIAIVPGVLNPSSTPSPSPPSPSSTRRPAVLIDPSPPPSPVGKVHASNIRSFLSDEVVIGINGDLPGWSLWDRNDDHLPKGFDGQLIKFLQQKYQFRPRFVRMNSKVRETALKDKKVDMVISNYSMTRTRAKDVHFAGPYFKDQSGLMVSNKKFEQYKLNVSIPVDNICVTKESTADQYIRRKKSSPQVADSLSECMSRLNDSSSRIVGIVTDKSILAAYKKAHPDDDKSVELAVWIGSKDPIETESYGIGIVKTKHSLTICKSLAKDVKEFLTSPTGWQAAFDDHLKDKSLEESNSSAHKPEAELVKCGVPLVIG